LGRSSVGSLQQGVQVDVGPIDLIERLLPILKRGAGGGQLGKEEEGGVGHGRFRFGLGSESLARLATKNLAAISLAKNANASTERTAIELGPTLSIVPVGNTLRYGQPLGQQMPCSGAADAGRSSSLPALLQQEGDLG
jgi:hypothetical protein